MREYEVKSGEHILGISKRLVHLANFNNEPVSAVFNGIKLIAEPGDNAESLYKQWVSKLDECNKAYRNSPEGKRAARDIEERRIAMQRIIDGLMERVESLNYSDLDQLVLFFDDITDPSDCRGVSFERNRVLEGFAAHGFAANANCGSDFDENDSEIYARWLIGQALSCLGGVGAVHQIYHKFASEWRARFTPTEIRTNCRSD